VNEVVGGWAAGYAMAILSTVAFTYLAFQPGPQKFVQRWIDPRVPGFLLAVPISIGTTIIWTMAGLVLASAYIVGGFESSPARSGPRLAVRVHRGGIGLPAHPGPRRAVTAVVVALAFHVAGVRRPVRLADASARGAMIYFADS